MKNAKDENRHIARYLSERSLIPACLRLRPKKGNTGKNFLAGFRNNLEPPTITFGDRNVYGSFII